MTRADYETVFCPFCELTRTFAFVVKGNCGFGAAWSFMVAFKAYSTRRRWFRNPAEVDVAIQKRGKRTKSGANPFVYFDGATMFSYQVPPRSMENVFCRRRPTPLECLDSRLILNPSLPSAPISSFKVKASEVGKRAGRGVFATTDIPRYTYIAPEEAVKTVRFYPYTYQMIVKLKEEGPIEKLLRKFDDDAWYSKVARQSETVDYYLHGYGFTNRKHVCL